MIITSAQPSFPTLALNDGRRMPILGLGCADFTRDVSLVRDAVYQAIKIGYRHFDTAYLYQTERAVGEGIQAAISEGLVKREDVFVTTKIWMYNLRRDDLIAQAKESNQALGLKYIDLLLIHGPLSFKKESEQLFLNYDFDGKPVLDAGVNIHTESWPAMEECVRMGLAKSIGVSNYTIDQLNKTLAHARIKPAVNQVESNPFLQQSDLLEFCKQHGIVLTAYSPFGGDVLPTDPNLSQDTSKRKLELAPLIWESETIKKMAEKHGKTIAQILLKIHVGRGVSVIPKTISVKRLMENADIFDFDLDPIDWSKIKALDSGRSMLPDFWRDSLRNA